MTPSILARTNHAAISIACGVAFLASWQDASANRTLKPLFSANEHIAFPMHLNISVYRLPETSTPIEWLNSALPAIIVPLPRLAHKNPFSSSIFFALRTVPLATLKRFASADSLGNISRGWYLPPLISLRSSLYSSIALLSGIDTFLSFVHSCHISESRRV